MSLPTPGAANDTWGTQLNTFLGVSLNPDGTLAPPVSSTQTGSTYTFVLGDAGTVVEGNSASAQTFTIPPHSSVAWATGTVMEVFQYGAGQITIAAGVGVTLRSDGAKVKTAAQYATIGLRCRATDEWVISGDLI